MPAIAASQHQRSRLRCITPEGSCDMLAAVSVWYCGVIRSRICCVTTTDIGDMFALCHLLARQDTWYLVRHRASEMVSWALQKLIFRSSPKMRPPTLRSTSQSRKIGEQQTRVLEYQNYNQITLKILRWSLAYLHTSYDISIIFMITFSNWLWVGDKTQDLVIIIMITLDDRSRQSQCWLITLQCWDWARCCGQNCPRCWRLRGDSCGVMRGLSWTKHKQYHGNWRAIQYSSHRNYTATEKMDYQGCWWHRSSLQSDVWSI